ncbi:MAG: heme NO-binding domain-containing protein [Spirosomataceae bacterium]
MKGIVFTEFIDMVESKFGFGMMDEIIETAKLPSGGIYTAVGTYDHSEMVKLVVELSNRTQIPINELLKSYGKHLLGVFTKGYPHFFENTTDAFSFFEQIDQYIHVEVQKLYPDAELPKFDTFRINDNTLEMIYNSQRKMSDLAEGLIEATIEFFKEDSTVVREEMNPEGTIVKFTITRV